MAHFWRVGGVHQLALSPAVLCARLRQLAARLPNSGAAEVVGSPFPSSGPALPRIESKPG
jgi:hypothetical protein